MAPACVRDHIIASVSAEQFLHIWQVVPWAVFQNGFSLDITGDTTRAETVSVYVGGYNAKGNMTATLAGATTYTDSSVTYPIAGPKNSRVYTFMFQPDNVSDKLHIVFTQSNSGDANGHVLLSAVAVTPEPASLATATLATGGLLLRRRRK